MPTLGNVSGATTLKGEAARSQNRHVDLAREKGIEPLERGSDPGA